jgi:hypothetical protein
MNEAEKIAKITSYILDNTHQEIFRNIKNIVAWLESMECDYQEGYIDTTNKKNTIKNILNNNKTKLDSIISHIDSKQENALFSEKLKKDYLLGQDISNIDNLLEIFT